MNQEAMEESQKVAISNTRCEGRVGTSECQIIAKKPYYSDLDSVKDELRDRLICVMLQLRSLAAHISAIEDSYVPILLDYVEWCVCVEREDKLTFTEEKTSKYLLYLVQSNVHFASERNNCELVTDTDTLYNILDALKKTSTLLECESYSDASLYTKIQLFDNDLQILRDGNFDQTVQVLYRAERLLLMEETEYNPLNPYTKRANIGLDKEASVSSSPPPVDSSVDGDQQDFSDPKELTAANILTQSTQIGHLPPSSDRSIESKVDVQATLSTANNSQQSKDTQKLENSLERLPIHNPDLRIKKIAGAIMDENIRKEFLQFVKDQEKQRSFVEAYDKTKDAFATIMRNLDSFKDFQSVIPNVQALLELVSHPSLNSGNSNEISIRSSGTPANRSTVESQKLDKSPNPIDLAAVRHMIIEESNKRREATKLLSNYFDNKIRRYCESARNLETKVNSIQKTHFGATLLVKEELNLLKNSTVSNETHSQNMSKIEENLNTITSNFLHFGQEMEIHSSIVAGLEEKTGQALQKIVSLQKRYGQDEDAVKTLAEEIRREVLNEETLENLEKDLKSSEYFKDLKSDLSRLTGKHYENVQIINSNERATRGRIDKIIKDISTLDKTLIQLSNLFEQKEGERNSVENLLSDMINKNAQSIQNIQNSVTELKNDTSTVERLRNLTKLVDDLAVKVSSPNFANANPEEILKRVGNLELVATMTNDAVKTMVQRLIETKEQAAQDLDQAKLSRTKDRESQANFKAEIERNFARQESEYSEYKSRTEQSTNDLYNQINELQDKFQEKANYDQQHLSQAFLDVFSQIGEMRSTQRSILERMNKLEGNLSRADNFSIEASLLARQNNSFEKLTIDQAPPCLGNGDSPARQRRNVSTSASASPAPITNTALNKTKTSAIAQSGSITPIRPIHQSAQATTNNLSNRTSVPQNSKNQVTPQQHQLNKVRKRAQEREKQEQQKRNVEANKRVANLLQRKKANKSDGQRKRVREEPVMPECIVLDEEQKEEQQQIKQNELQIQNPIPNQGQNIALKKIKLFRNFFEQDQ